jgi:hypothetical protein
MSIKQLVQAGFGAFGLRLTRVSNEPKHYYDQMDSFFLVLKRRGFSPNHIVDVGSKPWVLDPHFSQIFSRCILHAD